MKWANGVEHLQKNAGSGAGSGGFRVFSFGQKSRVAEAPLHFLAGSAAGSGGFRVMWGVFNVPKQANCVRHLDKNERAPDWISAGSSGLRRPRQALASGFRRVLAGSAARARAERGSGPTCRSKLLRRLASRLAIVASKLLLYKLGIQSNALHVWFIVVASLLPWRTHASQ